MTNVIKLSAFGKNDVRGIYNDDITPDLFCVKKTIFWQKMYG